MPVTKEKVVSRSRASEWQKLVDVMGSAGEVMPVHGRSGQGMRGSPWTRRGTVTGDTLFSRLDRLTSPDSVPAPAHLSAVLLCFSEKVDSHELRQSASNTVIAAWHLHLSTN